MQTAVVILNWNTRQFLQDFLPSLVGSLEGLDAQVVIADNGSSDDSVDFVKEHYPDLQLIELDSNYGFTGGYNRAVEKLLKSEQTPEYLILINSDILVDKGWIEPLIEHLESDTKCGACAPKLKKLIRTEHGYQTSDSFEYAGAAGGYIDKYGFPFCRGRVLKSVELDKNQYSSDSVFWVSGACFATRSALWMELGGLDERFFAHMEEIDYCWRAQLLGYKIDAVMESEVFHLGGGTLAQSSPFKLKLNFRNSLLCLEKNLPLTVTGARRRIFIRKFLDLCAAFAYLICGKLSCTRAVIQAHKEYRQLRIIDMGIATHSVKNAGAQVLGMQNICIILRHLMGKL